MRNLPTHNEFTLSGWLASDASQHSERGPWILNVQVDDGGYFPDGRERLPAVHAVACFERDVRNVAQLKAGAFVEVRGKVGTYKNRTELIAHTVTEVCEDVQVGGPTA